MKLKLKNMTYFNWEEYHSFLYTQIEQARHFYIESTTAEVIIHSVLGLPRNQIHSILLSKFPDKKFNKQYCKSTAWKYREIIQELKEALQ
jgi:hypothetical protein